MKRSARLIFMLFAAALLVSAFSLRLALTVSADDTVILTVTGYRINEPKRETMPYFSGSTLYVPVSMFTALGLTCTNQSPLVILSNLKSGRILYFDTAAGTAADSDGSYHAAAVWKGSVCFVPFSFTADRLGLVDRYFDADPAPFARLSFPDDDVMSDESFLRYYASAAPPLLERYRSSSPGTSHPGSSVTTTPQTEPPRHYDVSLVIDGLSDLEAVLAALRTASVHAVFRVTPFEIAQNGALLRLVAVEGHTFVLAGSAGIAPAALEEANRDLFESARETARVVLFLDDPGSELSTALSAAGYCPVTAGFTFSANTRSELTQAHARLDTGSDVLVLPSDQAAAILPALFRLCSADSPTYLRLSELTAG